MCGIEIPLRVWSNLRRKRQLHKALLSGENIPLEQQSSERGSHSSTAVWGCRASQGNQYTEKLVMTSLRNDCLCCSVGPCRDAAEAITVKP